MATPPTPTPAGSGNAETIAIEIVAPTPKLEGITAAIHELERLQKTVKETNAALNVKQTALGGHRTKQELEGALDQLTAKRQAALGKSIAAPRHISTAEIAAQMGWPMDQVDRAMGNVRAKLKKHRDTFRTDMADTFVGKEAALRGVVALQTELEKLASQHGRQVQKMLAGGKSLPGAGPTGQTSPTSPTGPTGSATPAAAGNLAFNLSARRFKPTIIGDIKLAIPGSQVQATLDGGVPAGTPGSTVQSAARTAEQLAEDARVAAAQRAEVAAAAQKAAAQREEAARKKRKEASERSSQPVPGALREVTTFDQDGNPVVTRDTRRGRVRVRTAGATGAETLTDPIWATEQKAMTDAIRAARATRERAVKQAAAVTADPLERTRLRRKAYEQEEKDLREVQAKAAAKAKPFGQAITDETLARHEVEAGRAKAAAMTERLREQRLSDENARRQAKQDQQAEQTGRKAAKQYTQQAWNAQAAAAKAKAAEESADWTALKKQRDGRKEDLARDQSLTPAQKLQRKFALDKQWAGEAGAFGQRATTAKWQQAAAQSVTSLGNLAVPPIPKPPRAPGGGGGTKPPNTWLGRGAQGWSPEGFGKNVLTVGGWMMAVNAFMAVSNAATYSFKRMEELQLQTARLTQVFRHGAAGAAGLADDVLKLGIVEGRASDEAVDSALKWSRLGFTRQQAAEASRVALMGANVAEMDAGQTTQHLSAIYAAYRLRVYELEGALGQLNQTSNTYRVTNADMLQGISRVAGVAQQAGVSFAQLQGTVGVNVARTGQTGPMMGNALKTILVRMQREDVREKLQSAYGVQLRGGSEGLDQMASLWGTLNDEQRLNLTLTVAGATQASRFVSILENYTEAQSAAVESLKNLNSAEIESQKIRGTFTARKAGLVTAWDRMINQPAVMQAGSMAMTVGTGVLGSLTGDGTQPYRAPGYHYDPERSGGLAGLAKAGYYGTEWLKTDVLNQFQDATLWAGGKLGATGPYKNKIQALDAAPVARANFEMMMANLGITSGPSAGDKQRVGLQSLAQAEANATAYTMQAKQYTTIANQLEGGKHYLNRPGERARDIAALKLAPGLQGTVPELRAEASRFGQQAAAANALAQAERKKLLDANAAEQAKAQAMPEGTADEREAKQRKLNELRAAELDLQGRLNQGAREQADIMEGLVEVSARLEGIKARHALAVGSARSLNQLVPASSPEAQRQMEVANLDAELAAAERAKAEHEAPGRAYAQAQAAARAKETAASAPNLAVGVADRLRAEAKALYTSVPPVGATDKKMAEEYENQAIKLRAQRDTAQSNPARAAARLASDRTLAAGYYQSYGENLGVGLSEGERLAERARALGSTARYTTAPDLGEANRWLKYASENTERGRDFQAEAAGIRREVAGVSNENYDQSYAGETMARAGEQDALAKLHYGAAATQRKKAYELRRGVGDPGSGELKDAPGVNASDNEKMRYAALAEQAMQTQISMRQRMMGLLREEKELHLAIAKSQEKALALGRPKDQMQRLAVAQLLPKLQKDPNMFQALSPEAREMAYEMMGGDQGRDLRREKGALNKAGVGKLSLEALQSMQAESDATLAPVRERLGGKSQAVGIAAMTEQADAAARSLNLFNTGLVNAATALAGLPALIAELASNAAGPGAFAPPQGLNTGWVPGASPPPTVPRGR